MNENIYKFFEDNLNNITARVLLGSVSIEGHMEGECLLKVEQKFQGVYVYSELKWNDLKVSDIIFNIMTENRDFFTYKESDKIRDKIIPVLNEQWVRIGTIRPYGIKSINSIFYEKRLRSVHITYEDGSICKIDNIKPSTIVL